MAAETFTLGERTFALAETTTSRQDGWLMVQLEDAGVLDLLYKRSNAGPGVQGAQSADDEQTFARKLITQARRSGKFELIAACVLVEPEKRWSIDEAKKNAEAFADLTDPHDKINLALAFANGLTRFFLSGSGSSAPSPTASTTDSPDAPMPPTSDPGSIAESAVSGPTAPAGSPTATERASN